MPNTLQQQIAADAQAGGVFFQGSGKAFDELITHYPAGDLSAAESVSAVVDRDLEELGGAGSGEGPRLDTPAGVKLRRNATVELPITITVTESSGTQTSQPSLFDFDGHRWRAVRILGRDAAMQAVLLTRIDKLVTRRVQHN